MRSAMASMNETTTLHHHEEVMGTVVTFTLFPTSNSSESELFVRLASARASLHRADAVFSTWKHLSPLNRLRRGEIERSECPDEISEVLDRCAALRDATDGWFDPWAMPGGVDPTGLVKGWAAERALRALESPGITGAIVNAAGDVATSGAPSESPSFRVGIVNPTRPHQIACVVESPGAVATSGTYERGAHLIDPYTGRPTCRSASATVTGPSLATADALATALALAGREGLSFISRSTDYTIII